jgi:hypothetical protein
MNVGGHHRLTATGTVKTRGGALLGFYVNSTTAGTLTLYDQTSAAAPQISGVITPAIGWHFLPVKFATALHVVVGGTIDVTFVLLR